MRRWAVLFLAFGMLGASLVATPGTASAEDVTDLGIDPASYLEGTVSFKPLQQIGKSGGSFTFAFSGTGVMPTGETATSTFTGDGAYTAVTCTNMTGVATGTLLIGSYQWIINFQSIPEGSGITLLGTATSTAYGVQPFRATFTAADAPCASDTLDTPDLSLVGASVIGEGVDVQVDGMDVVVTTIAGPEAVYVAGDAVEETEDDLAGSVSCGGLPTTWSGTDGPDNKDGSSVADSMHGRGSYDNVDGLSGPDKVCGGKGDDDLDGGPGNDRVLGGPGGDHPDAGGGVFGGTGGDVVMGGSGRDFVSGQDGDDGVYGGNGFDSLKDGYGLDAIYANDDNKADMWSRCNDGINDYYYAGGNDEWSKVDSAYCF